MPRTLALTMIGCAALLAAPAPATGAGERARAAGDNEKALADRRPARPPKPPAIAVDRDAKPLRIAFISYANPQQVAVDSAVVVEYLERYAGVPVEGAVTNDYASSVEAMRYGQADLAFVDPLAFMMAHEQIGAVPVVLEVYASGKPSYSSCVWVRSDSGIKSVEDLRGGTIAFADQVDMSGHLLPREIFVRKGLIGPSDPEGDFFRQVYFAGGDEQAVRAVLNGFVDAAGVSEFSYLLLRPEERDGITVIEKSIASPSHLVMARKELDAAVRDRVRRALLALDPGEPEDKTLLSRLYGVQGFVEARLEHFEEVAEVAARYGFVRDPRRFAKRDAGGGE